MLHGELCRQHHSVLQHRRCPSSQVFITQVNHRGYVIPAKSLHHARQHLIFTYKYVVNYAYHIRLVFTTNLWYYPQTSGTNHKPLVFTLNPLVFSVNPLIFTADLQYSPQTSGICGRLLVLTTNLTLNLWNSAQISDLTNLWYFPQTSSIHYKLQ